MPRDKEIIQKQSAMVVKGDDLIWNAKFSLTAQQQKIVISLISQIEESKGVKEPYSFDITQFCKMCGLGRADGRYYAKVKSDLLYLTNKGVWRQLADGSIVTVRWLSKVKIQPKSGTITVWFDEDMEDVLFGLKRRFVQYCLEYILPLTAKYSIRLYELLKSYQFQGEYCHIELQELKERIDAEKYDRTIDLRRRVIEPSLLEINTYTDIEVKAEPWWDNNKTIKGFRFQIIPINGRYAEIERRRINRWDALGIEITPEAAGADFSGLTPEDEVE